MKGKPKIGTEFPITTAEMGKTAAELTRSMIALTFVVPSVLALIGAVGLSLHRGEFSTLTTLWAVLAAPLGMIVGHYFRGGSFHGKDNHEGPD